MAVAGQFRYACRKGGHGREVGARQMRIRHAHSNIALAKKEKFHQGKRINAGLRQWAVFVKFLSFSYKIGPGELTKPGCNLLGVCFQSHRIQLFDEYDLEPLPFK